MLEKNCLCGGVIKYCYTLSKYGAYVKHYAQCEDCKEYFVNMKKKEGQKEEYVRIYRRVGIR